MNTTATFKKSERLVSTKAIELLFKEGKSLNSFPIRLVYKKKEVSGQEPVQILMSVPKRNFKRAVDRNLLKRRMREAYRKNKHSLISFFVNSNSSYQLMLIYSGKEKMDYMTIESKIVSVLNKLQQQLQHVK